MFELTHFTYQGYEYRTWDDVDDDVIKTYHECWREGCEVRMPRAFYNTSPYELVKYEDFCGYVDQVRVAEFFEGKKRLTSQ